jgi:hypothetical protein
LSREAIQGQDQLLQETELTFMSKQFWPLTLKSEPPSMYLMGVN